MEIPPVPKKSAPGTFRTFSCPSCAGSIVIKATGISIQAICSYCSSVIDTTDENLRIINKANEKIRPTLIEIGQRGKLFNVNWEVIGYTKKRDGNYFWDEYLLFNPYYGFRFLVENQGHWNFIKILRRAVSDLDDSTWIRFQGVTYQLFLRGKAVVDYVKGEFYWRVKQGETTQAADYIAPPQMLSIEKNQEEIIVSTGEYLEAQKVASAFKIKKIPSPIGVAPNQPAPYQGSIWTLLSFVVFFIILTTMVQSHFEHKADKKDVYASQTLVSPSNISKSLSSPSFVIPKQSNFVFKSYAELDNNWIELDVSLVNEQTQQIYSIRQGLEYYHGIDSDGPWREGEPRSKTYISCVPPGNYRLLIDYEMEPFGASYAKNVHLNLSASYDVPAESNYWLIILFMLLYPVSVMIMRWRFECNRWSTSDYAPSIYSVESE